MVDNSLRAACKFLSYKKKKKKDLQANILIAKNACNAFAKGLLGVLSNVKSDTLHSIRSQNSYLLPIFNLPRSLQCKHQILRCYSLLNLFYPLSLSRKIISLYHLAYSDNKYYYTEGIIFPNQTVSKHLPKSAKHFIEFLMLVQLKQNILL